MEGSGLRRASGEATGIEGAGSCRKLPRMKILHVCTTFIHRSSGISRVYKRLAAMVASGYQVGLVVGRDYQPDPDWDMSEIRVYRVETLVKYVSPKNDLKTLVALHRLFNEIRPDVVHTHLAKGGVLGRWSAYLSGTPLIFHTVHGPTFASTLPAKRRMAYLALEWMTGRITDHFFFVGQEILNEYVASGVSRAGNSSVIRTGRPDAEIDQLSMIGSDDVASIRRSFLAEHDCFLVACVGRIVPSKGQDHAIRATRSLRAFGINAKLLIIGDALLEEETVFLRSLQDLSKELGLEKHVLFTGYREDALHIMASADAIVHTSKYEGLPNVFVEAGLVSKPLVCYRVLGASETVDEGKTGYIVEQDNIEGLVKRLYELWDNPALAKELGRNAHEKVALDYRESTMIKRKLELYRQLIGEQEATQAARFGKRWQISFFSRGRARAPNASSCKECGMNTSNGGST